MATISASTLIRVIRYIVIATAMAALAVVYWFAWRPLPQTSGTIAVPVTASVRVVRDSLGVPHISAANENDLLFAQGYVTAQDRLFQLDTLRRVAAGDLSEVFGPATLALDREARLLRMRRIAEQHYLTLTQQDRERLSAYARGINAFLSTHRNRLPVDFALAGYSPRPWSVVDSILIALHMFRNLTSTWKDELAKTELLSSGVAEKDKINLLFPVRSGLEPLPGSNAWAISGAHTASGKPILSNDMHLEYSFPSIWYMAHLQGAGINVSGVTLPGVPGVIVGHNDRIAWGITNLGFDVQDLYIEQLDERTGRYVFQGKVEQGRLERDVIRVKGQQPVEVATWVTRHGPLFAGEKNTRMTLRWIAAEPGIFRYPILEINRAGNWKEFTAAIEQFNGPGSNFVYADVDGNIGYHAAGKLPVRRNHSGDVAVDGASGNFEWEAPIPFDELPQAFNPPSGIIVTANQNPFPADYTYRVNGNFAPHYRARQIRDLLGSKNGWRAPDMLVVQKDVYSSFAHFLARQIVAAYENRRANNPRIADAIALLKNWNGQMDKDSSAALVAALSFGHLRRVVADRAASGKSFTYENQIAPAVLENLLRTRPAGWFDDYDETLLRVLIDAVEEGRRMQGKNLNKWAYGDYLDIPLNNPVLHQLPWIHDYLEIGKVRMSGSSTTVKQTTQKLEPSMRMNAELGNWDGSQCNITIGQSGQALSSHYKDQWDAFYYGRSFPMQFRKIDAKDTLELVPGSR